MPNHFIISPLLIERFWSKVIKSSDPDACWLWQAGRTPNGYGAFWVKEQNSNISAHRISYQLTYGIIDDPQAVVMHTCDVPRCVNPAHLRLGTQADNYHDMMNKGRHYTQNNRQLIPRGEQRPQAKLTREKVNDARQRFAAGESNISQLARENGVAIEVMRRAIHNISWREYS